MDIRHTTVLITGASRGLGAELARRLAGAGARVVLVARDPAPLSRLVAEIRAAGGQAHALPGDVGDKTQTHAIAGAAAALVGPIDLLIHNASTLGPLPMPLLLDTACEDLQAVLETNLVGPFRLTKAVGGAMALRGRGLIVQVSSDAAVAAYPRWGSYGVSKAALDHLGRILAAELEGSGVRVVLVDPGEMDTQMHRDALPDADPSTLASPALVAAKIVRLIEGAEQLGSGTRFEASRLLAEVQS